ncbi:MAG: HNH endonuclease [Buchananella hordeovulneris]|nr:HNH endonuclease [Buchananella hordeovulneris]
MGRQGRAATSRDSNSWRMLQRRVMAEARRLRPPCGLCGLPINYHTRNANAVDAPSVDHIKPWAAFPHLRDDPANVMVVHQGCNKAKGARLQVPSIGNTSRRWGAPPEAARG